MLSFSTPGLAAVLAQADDSAQKTADAVKKGGDALGAGIEAAIIMAVAIALAAGVRWLIARVGRREDSTSSAAAIMARLAFALVVAIGAYVALKSIGLDLGPVLAGAGIAGVAIAFALRDIAENYISEIIMGFRNPFSPGDQISSGEHEGTVEELNLRYTTIRTYDGVRVLLPNAGVLKTPLSNLTTNGNRRTDFQIGVAYGTDLELARRVAIEAVSSAEGGRHGAGSSGLGGGARRLVDQHPGALLARPADRRHVGDPQRGDHPGRAGHRAEGHRAAVRDADRGGEPPAGRVGTTAEPCPRAGPGGRNSGEIQ